MIKQFKIFEQVKNTFEKNEPVRLKIKGNNMIFFIDQVTDIINLYHVKDDNYIYSGFYYNFELEKVSDEEKAALKYNL